MEGPIPPLKSHRLCARDVPAEIWQDVFRLAILKDVQDEVRSREPKQIWLSRTAVLDEEVQVPDPRFLGQLCLVCRLWRVAAVGDPALWTLPRITVSSKVVPGASQSLQEYIKLVVERSGTRPLSFEFRALDIINSAAVVHSTLALLTQIGPRWCDASIRGPAEIMETLCTLNDTPLPYLRRLTLVLDNPHTRMDWIRKRDPHIRCFAISPSLRHLEIHYSLLHCGSLTFDLPWAQLESFRCVGVDGALYDTLIEAQPKGLKSVACLLDQAGVPLTSVPYSSPTLTCLRVRVKVGWGEVGFRNLTLPALQELEVVSRRNRVYHMVESLIVRSGRVAVGGKASEDLSITSPNEEILDALILPNSGAARECAVPDLKRLTIHTSRRIPSPPLLAAILRSRKKSSSSATQGLEELVLVNMFHLAVEKETFESARQLYEDSLYPASDPLATKCKDTLAKLKGPQRFTSKWPRNYDPWRLVNLEGTLCALERLDLAALADLRVLSRNGALDLIEFVIDDSEDIMLSGVPFARLAFRDRASALRRSWREALIQAMRSDPYYWIHPAQGDNLVVFRRVSPKNDPGDDAIWDYLTGKRRLKSTTLGLELGIPLMTALRPTII
ncbi:hypothetical protein DFP72DRAFT_1162381 [Ephemerocybe angulata]|uniref:F-box domain-containing protein n=1 Tax=Ephemerocybe angulata TaxID=980116 RepID=A0A8H6II98_9AGAR|nr:hypothetical protein DFP72DRAFT_1162381 [Tulosesus angulatus]